MTITVPADLKARMDDAGAEINWSAVASRAFEERLTEIASSRKEKTMNEVVQRLRGSLKTEENRSFQMGRNDGRRWAEDLAEVHHLWTLENLSKKLPEKKDWEDALKKHKWNFDWLWWEFDPQFRNHPALKKFEDQFRMADDDRAINLPSYVHGFVEGGLSLWREVKDKL
jgi:hypothetical protein